MKQKEKITTCRFRNLFANTVIPEGNLKGWRKFLLLCKFLR